jgi:hypothetical protein
MAIQKSKRLRPLHPGEALKELLTEAGLTVNALALAQCLQTESGESSRASGVLRATYLCDWPAISEHPLRCG